MKILLLGKNGQVGWELQRALAPLGELIALDRQVNAQGYCGDLENLQLLIDTIRSIKPDVIVNAAAYTAVDKAETEIELANQINNLAVESLAAEALKCNAWLIHYSTDYVFNGAGNKAWIETDVVQPLNIYGASKLAGEQKIQASGCKHLIFRTSWVYSSRGNNFAKTMLRLATSRESLSVINDQIGAPTGADLIADVTAQALSKCHLQPQLSGLYHLVATGKTSWFEYAKLVLSTAQKSGIELKVKPNSVQAIPTSAFPTPATRPQNSCLNTAKLVTAFKLTLPAWEVGVIRMLAEITP